MHAGMRHGISFTHLLIAPARLWPFSGARPTTIHPAKGPQEHRSALWWPTNHGGGRRAPRSPWPQMSGSGQPRRACPTAPILPAFPLPQEVPFRPWRAPRRAADSLRRATSRGPRRRRCGAVVRSCGGRHQGANFSSSSRLQGLAQPGREAPRPASGGSGFVSPDNDDQSAANTVIS